MRRRAAAARVLPLVPRERGEVQRALPNLDGMDHEEAGDVRDPLVESTW